MTEKEEKLLEIAKEFIRLNKDSRLNLRLTGSLMLALRGIDKRREAHDIDFLVNEEVMAYERGSDSTYSPQYPKEYILSYEGDRSQPDSIQVENMHTGLKVDFLVSNEDAEIVDGIPCGSLEGMIEAKLRYMENDNSEESRCKHRHDMTYLAKDLGDSDLLP